MTETCKGMCILLSMDEDVIGLAERAVARLSSSQLDLVAVCFRAIVDGPYITSDDEFHALMGAWRHEVTMVAEAWPRPVDGDVDTFTIVNNTLFSLLSFPHREWPVLAATLGIDESAARVALRELLDLWRFEIPSRRVDVDYVALTRDAVARLTGEQKEFVQICLDAATEQLFFGDDKLFEEVIRMSRAEGGRSCSSVAHDRVVTAELSHGAHHTKSAT
jgi:hypothetical protein